METVKALLAAHSTERRIFARIIDLDVKPDLAQRIVAYWMYLESQDCKGLVRSLSSHDDKFLSLVCTEAEAALACLQHESDDTSISSISPITSNLYSLYEIFGERERVSRGVADIFDGLCTVLFEDILDERGLRGGDTDDQGNIAENEKGKGKEGESGSIALNPSAKEFVINLVRAAGEGTSTRQGVQVVPGGCAAGSEVCENGGESGGACGSGGESTDGGSSTADSSGLQGGGLLGTTSNLNPNAEEWHPSSEVAERDRCLYITFSNGFPLSPNQIYLFFTTTYGPCVEKIHIHQPIDSVPLFGKITFKVSFIPALILNGREQVKFRIFGRTLWCKKYNRRIN